MLLDEPFAGIDPIAVGDIQALVRHLTNRGIGVLITDHNVRETLGLTDRAYIIYSGEVLMEGRPTTSSTIRRCAGSISARNSGCRRGCRKSSAIGSSNGGSCANDRTLKAIFQLNELYRNAVYNGVGIR